MYQLELGRARWKVMRGLQRQSQRRVLTLKMQKQSEEIICLAIA